MRSKAAVLVVALALLPVAARADRPRPVASPFAVRGIKGLWWPGIENYRKALPWLADRGLNFLMLCYSSFPASGKDWRADYTSAEQQQFRDLAAEAKRRGVTLCLSFNPGIWSKPPLEYSSEADYQRALRKVRSVQALGIEWFGLCLDDINRALTPADKARFGTLQAAQAYFVNRLWRDMKAASPSARLIFCPSAYTTEDARHHLDYITAIGRDLDPDIMVFWTGPTVVSKTITAADAREFGAWIRRKPFVWDNYLVNDYVPWRPLLAPVKGRSADLAGAVSGYMANPMKQWEMSRIPLATLADYLRDPEHYDPGAAMADALAEFGPRDRDVVRQVVDLYGSAFPGDPGFPPAPHPADAAAARAALAEYEALEARLERESRTAGSPAFADLLEEVAPTLKEDIAALRLDARDPSPLYVPGDRFTGGAAEVFGARKFGRRVNYVYARSTGRDTMRAVFTLTAAQAARPITLRLVARDDDSGAKPSVRIALNGVALVEGPSPFSAAGFTERTFTLPASALRAGQNALTITNLASTGPLGSPPWFMVAEAEIVVE